MPSERDSSRFLTPLPPRGKQNRKMGLCVSCWFCDDDPDRERAPLVPAGQGAPESVPLGLNRRVPCGRDSQVYVVGVRSFEHRYASWVRMRDGKAYYTKWGVLGVDGAREECEAFKEAWAEARLRLYGEVIEWSPAGICRVAERAPSDEGA